MYKYDILEKKNLLKEKKKSFPMQKKLKLLLIPKGKSTFFIFHQNSIHYYTLCMYMYYSYYSKMYAFFLILLKWLCVPIRDQREKKAPLCPKAPRCKNAISNEKQTNGKDPQCGVGEEPSLGDTDLLGGTVGLGRHQDRASGSVQIAEGKPRGRRH